MLIPYSVFSLTDDNISEKGKLKLAPSSWSMSGKVEHVIEEDLFGKSSEKWQVDKGWLLDEVDRKNIAKFGNGKQYQNNSSSSLVTPEFRLPITQESNSQLKLIFEEWFAIESLHDFGRVLISTENENNWKELHASTGKSDWRTTAIDITAYEGQSVRFKFQFSSDESIVFGGWKIRTSRISIISKKHPTNHGTDNSGLEAALVNLNHQNFPFIYSNVRVLRNGEALTELTKSNFQVFENDNLQTDYFEVTPPETGGGSRVADIVFLMDNSGSMSDEQNDVRNNVIDFVNSLSNSGVDFTLGLCRYGQSDGDGMPIIEDDGQLTDDTEYFKNEIWNRNVTAGGNEPGYYAITQSAAGFNFRPGSQKILIEITDETPDQGGATLEEAQTICVNNSITLFALTSTDLFPKFEPITNATNGAHYDIYSEFTDILNYISEEVSSNYLIRYQSSNPAKDGTQRDVRIETNYMGEQAIVQGTYFPGAIPKISRTYQTRQLHTKPWAEETEFTIQVEIQDNVEPFVNNAIIYYKNTSSNTYTSQSMNNTSGILWEGSIPPAVVSPPGLDYYITASDGENTASDPSVNPRSKPYQIAILPNEAPAIEHTPVTELNPGVRIVVSASIRDRTNELISTQLYYRKIGQLLYTEVEMTNVYGNNYEGTIPSEVVTKDGVEYYIEAKDDFGISGNSGTKDEPHIIKAESELIPYIDKKYSIIEDIKNIERPFYRYSHPFYNDIENKAKTHLDNISEKIEKDTYHESEIEAIARLYLTEDLSEQAIRDVLDISEYGAKSLRSIAVTTLLSGAFRKIADKVKHIKLVGNKAANVSNNISQKMLRVANKLFDRFVNLVGTMEEPKIIYDAMGSATQRLLETGDNAVDKKFDVSVFDKADDFIQEFLFLEPYEFFTDENQEIAVQKTMEENFGYGHFYTVEQDMARHENVMISENNQMKDAANFLNTINEYSEWAVLIGTGIVLTVAGILAAIPSAGASLIVSIGSFAAVAVKISFLVSQFSAGTEAATSLAYTYLAVPNFVNESVDIAFGDDDNFTKPTIENQQIVTVSTDRYRTLHKTLTPFKSYNSVNLGSNMFLKEYNFYSNIRAEMDNGDYSFLEDPELISSHYDSSAIYEDRVGTIFRSIADTASQLDSSYINKLNSFNNFVAARNSASCAMDIYSLLWESGIKNDSLKSEIKDFTNTYIEFLSKIQNYQNSIDSIATQNNLPIPPAIFIKDVGLQKFTSTGTFVLTVDIENVSPNPAVGQIDVVLDSDFSTSEDTIKTISIGSNAVKIVRFPMSINTATRISGYIYTRDHLVEGEINQNLNSHSGGRFFNLQSNKAQNASPNTGFKLDDENTYFYPNPFNPEYTSGTIRYSLSSSGAITINIYDASNRLVKTLIENQPKPANTELSETWDGRNENGDPVANGVYFYVIESNRGERAVGKIAILK